MLKRRGIKHGINVQFGGLLEALRGYIVASLYSKKLTVLQRHEHCVITKLKGG